MSYDPETMDDTSLTGPAAAEAAAEEAGLRYVHDDKPGITRARDGDGWAYTDAKGRPITDEKTVARINKLAIPPAYTDVWICPNPRGHLQATGRDARGRKQYRYHADFRAVREEGKFEHMLEFARALPAIRARVSADMAMRGLPREKVLATVVYLLEHTLIRVGNEEYAKTNESFGLTTLNEEHVDVTGAELKFHFKGKSGKEWNLKLKDRRVAKTLKAAQELPGQHLFHYKGEDGTVHDIGSADVNAYLHEIAGPGVTAKNFRTWAGTVLAALALHEMEASDSPKLAKKNVRAAIERVAAQLGNTPTVCRKSYVHPEVVNAYMDRGLMLEIVERIEEELGAQATLRPEEQAVLAFLHARLAAAAG